MYTPFAVSAIRVTYSSAPLLQRYLVLYLLTFTVACIEDIQGCPPLADCKTMCCSLVHAQYAVPTAHPAASQLRIM